MSAPTVVDLLEAWRASRAVELADAIDRIAVTPVPVADWAKVAATKDPDVLGGLLATVPELAASFLPTAASVLGTFGDDPRITGAMRAWILDPPTTSSSTYPFWTKMFELAVRTRDVRLVAACTKRLKLPQKNSQFWPKFYAVLERTKVALAATTPGVVDAKAIAKLAKGKRAPAKVVAIAPRARSTQLLLVQAREHLVAGRIAPAIDAMVERWRELRVPALADLVDRASTLLPHYDLPLPAGTAKQAEAAWDAAFADGAARMPQLLTGVLVGGVKLAELRLARLASLPADPRIAQRLAELAGLAHYRVASPVRTQFWKAMFELLVATGDTRSAEPLRLAFANAAGDFAGTYYNHHRQAKRLLAPFVTAVAAATDPVYPTTPELAAAASLASAVDAAIAKDPARTLVAAIVAAPDDPAPRLVYADWLSDRGHPRGEAIVLAEAHHANTATPAQRDRLADLYHGGQLFGPFEELCAMPSRGPRQEPTIHLDDYTNSCPRALPKALALIEAGLVTWQRAVEHPLMPLVDTLDAKNPAIYGDLGDPHPILALLGPAFRYIEASGTFTRSR